MFHVGQRVVFIGYPVRTVMMAAREVVHRVPYCEIGAVYQIQGVEQRARFRSGKWKGPSLHLGFFDPMHGPVWHHSSGFRPAVEPTTDISIFTAMLSPSERVPA